MTGPTYPFFKQVNRLQPELQSILERIGELDREATELGLKAAATSRAALGCGDGHGSHRSGGRAPTMSAAIGLAQRVVEISGKKHNLAKSLYSAIEKQVRHVDKHRAILSDDILKREQELGLPPSVQLQDTNTVQGPTAMQPAPQPVSAPTTGKPKRKRKADEMLVLPPPLVPVMAPGMVPFTFHLPGREPFEEMVDPSEPLYCFCQQPTQGDMLGCDGDDCPHDWFHYACVGHKLSQPVPKQWFCSECRGKDANKSTKRGKKR